MSRRRWALAIVGPLVALASIQVGSAEAAFGIADFQVAASKATGAAETQAGAHPYALEVGLDLDTDGGVERLREATVRMPPGLLVNPVAVSECRELAFHTPRSQSKPGSLSGESCPNGTQVGVIRVNVGGAVRYFGLFNLVPPYGSVAAIGASPFGVPLVFTVEAREEDAGLDLRLREVPESFDLRSMRLTIWGTPWWGDNRASETHDPQRGNCLDEETGGSLASDCQVNGPGIQATETAIKSYLTLPTANCGVPLSFAASAGSWAGETQPANATIPAMLHCNKTLTTPKVQLLTDAAAARTGLVLNLEVNDGGGILNPDGIARPPIKTAVLSLPDGLTINPSLGAGLGSCSEAEFARETASSEPGAGCPNASKIGDVVVDGVLGLSEPVSGGLYLATPRANRFGTLLAVYMVARSARRGIVLKSVGKIEPDPGNGRLLASFDELPRLLYTHFRLSLREGQRSTLVSPPLCGTYTAGLDIAPWADPAAFERTTSSFLITRGDAGAPCPGRTLGFSPALLAGSVGAGAGVYSPFYLRMSRTDAEQGITSYSATLPPGLLGRIAGIATCPDAAIAAAAARSGAEEQAAPSCPAASQVGRTMAGYGVGETLAWAPGNLYLAGPYHGSPLSLVAIDAATIGPFDLGTVVVRQAIRVDRRTAQVSLDAAGADPIPHILAGIPLHLRDIRVYVDRPGFMLNPTSCDPMRITSRLSGEGADPFSAADDSAAASSQRFQVLGCSALDFKPRLALRLLGSSRHGGFPSLRAEYRPRPGNANLGAVAVTLPPSIFLAQEHVDGVCTKVQFNADSCPASSVYGRARAQTPLLDEPLEGPVYLRSSRTSVPDLVADLRGRGIEIEVLGRIDSDRSRIRASFEDLPDAPVTSFTMTLFGGRRGLLANAEAPCAGVRRANARFVAQSNETAIVRPRLRAKCGKKRHRPGRGGSR